MTHRVKIIRLLFLLIGAMTLAASAANYYVRPTAQGSANGSDWNKAWSMANLNSNMGTLAAGDSEPAAFHQWRADGCDGAMRGDSQ